jgi:MFS family permease
MDGKGKITDTSFQWLEVYWTSIMLVAETAAAFFTCPVFGYWVDRTGQRKVPFLAGLVLLAASMCLFTVARSVATYIIARLLQGASAAMVEVAGLALLKDVVGKQGLGEALGYMGTGSMVGLMAGPPLGGLLNKVGGYHAVCVLGFAIVALDAALRLAVLEKGEVERGNNSARYSAIPSTDPEDQDAASGGNTTHPPSGLNAQWGVAFASLKLLKQPRVAITLWALVVDGIIIGAFDAVGAHGASSRRDGFLTKNIRPCPALWKNCSDGTRSQPV